ncbi:lysophospholipid acyltransferase family protein [Chitinophaga sp. GCM10012297]|uniref:Lysophospholipid acyltransferase family protein n=1 Tax=Chitinophaga chungangae TaxID=2821488 RepID=A0ABS3YI74_9BACT|nr:lysophospholipid acyltransferase family protein [Chitinophaga chungangae]MBO9153998.1 lysophospholipid acyltransferase family protein [Chitinophaga chungangae]
MIYLIVYKVLGYRYAVVLQNLSRSFPERSYEEVRQLAGGFYRHFSGIFSEMALMLFTPAARVKERVRVKNIDLLQYYHAQQRNVMIMLGHYGNWECLNVLPAKTFMNIHAVYKPLRNKFFDKIMRRLRTRFGLKLVPADKAARHMLASRDCAGAYIFVADQCPGNGAHTIDFLRQPTPVITGAERLARATGAVVLYATVGKAEAPAAWEISFQLITDAPGELPPFAITERFSRLLEEDIRRQPQYWLWTHRRWKKRPAL